MTEASDDASLATAAREGDRDAFAYLYSRYSSMVHGILLARVPSAELGDLVQDVFLYAFSRLGDLHHATRFGAWLAAITRSRANDHRRRFKRATAAKQVLSIAEEEARTTNLSEPVSGRKILDLIRTLPNAYRETLILRLVEGMSGPEIAARTGLTPGSVRVNLYRGMQQLRDELSKRSAP